MKPVRIIYMGTPEFAVAGLQALVENGYQVVAVVTMPDKPAGRGYQIQYSAVKQYALQHGLDILQPEKLKDPAFLEQLRSYHADLQIVTAFRMLPEAVWQMPRLGTFNVHGSLLPQYRGAAPINRAVMNGETETGLTSFMLKQEIDTGNILLQERIAIGEDEDVGSVHDRLMALSAGITLRTVELITACDEKGLPLPMKEQDTMTDGELKPAPKIFKEDCRIDFGKRVREVYNHIRGLSPYPAAWCDLDIQGQRYENVKVYRARPSDIPHADGRIIMPCADGHIELTELQLPGKKRMDAKALLNGLRNH